MIHSRQDLALSQRVVIKAGTSVVSTLDGYPSLSRIANIVENTVNLVRQGKEVLIVTSGAVGIGRQKLKKQAMLQQSMSDILSPKKNIDLNEASTATARGKISYNSACAAAGQLGLMSLYETMFSQYDITTSQLLVTAFDFTSPERRRNIQFVISQLLKLGIVPLLNENDAVSANQGYALFGNSFADNDSLASMVAVEMSAQLLILLTDVNGVYDRPPSDPSAKLINVFTRQSANFKVGEKSLQGRGGMGAKVDAALKAVNGGVQAVIIAAGGEHEVIDKIIRGDPAGTAFFLIDNCDSPEATNSGDDGADRFIDVMSRNTSFDVGANGHAADESLSAGGAHQIAAINGTRKGSDKEKTKVNISVEEIATRARDSSRQLNQVSESLRKDILKDIANSLQLRLSEILDANAVDLEAAEKSGLDNQSLKRLKLTLEKINVLVAGITSIADDEPCLGRMLAQTELADGLILDKLSCSLGVLLIIFESRPDCLPQIAALAIKSGNGLVLKGGKEAENSNKLLHSIITDSIERISQGQVDSGVIGLVSRAEIPSLLKLDGLIDLVIPRGSGELVKYIKDNTKIPVMGHAEGICHVYVDKDADIEKAIRIVVDSKIDYPSACNATECLLLHSSVVESGAADKILRQLRTHSVSLFGGPRALQLGLTERPVVDLRTEYGDLSLSVEVVDSVNDAIRHIHHYGSGHTESIVTENNETASLFLQSIDSACVFHNASTRFADGFRFGLGAEVGISTGRIHARGPVGVQGLLTYKWVLHSSSSHIVSDFSSSQVDKTPLKYTHKKLGN